MSIAPLSPTYPEKICFRNMGLGFMLDMYVCIGYVCGIKNAFFIKKKGFFKSHGM